MSPSKNSERVADIVESALECDLSGRAQFFEQACHGDVDLRKEVESLLRFAEKATDFIEKPAYEIAAERTPKFFASPDHFGIIDDSGERKAGEKLGEYKILSLIGEGGMGEVYLAEDTTLRRRVAIKLLKFGLGTTNIIRRFQQEERILAGLSHSNIAQLHGGAVTQAGLPYFVMEYVDGARLDDYCRDLQLSISQRLTLFRKICAAVSYAHQNLVIHRDIKPANIRVTSDGEPKLLDFGIAKLLDSEAPMVGEATMTFAAVMTPEYASPEQVRGGKHDDRERRLQSRRRSIRTVDGAAPLSNQDEESERDRACHHRTGTGTTKRCSRKIGIEQSPVRNPQSEIASRRSRQHHLESAAQGARPALWLRRAIFR